MITDDICEKYAPLKVGLTVRLVNPGDDDLTEGSPFVLIEGSDEALKFFSEIVSAIASDAQDTHRMLSPNGPGSIHFSKDATIGFYINRI